MNRSVGIVVPAYRPPVERLVSYVETLSRIVDPTRIRIELDAPRAATRRALSVLPAEVSTRRERRGKGQAITDGFDALDTDVRCFVDADGSTPARSVARVLEPVDRDEADLAVGSRRHPDARVTSHQTVVRRLLGDGFAWVARRCLDPALSDYQCGAKAITGGTWDVVREHVRETGFAWDVEVIALVGALGRRIAEVPVEWCDHPASTVGTATTVRALARGLVRARLRAARLRRRTGSAVGRRENAASGGNRR